MSFSLSKPNIFMIFSAIFATSYLLKKDVVLRNMLGQWHFVKMLGRGCLEALPRYFSYYVISVAIVSQNSCVRVFMGCRTTSHRCACVKLSASGVGLGDC